MIISGISKTKVDFVTKAWESMSDVALVGAITTEGTRIDVIR